MKYLYSLILLFLSISVSSQDIKNKYSFRTTDEGSIIFIYPLEGFECNELKKNKKLIYDITHVSNKDSVTINCTYYNENASPADSVFIYFDDKDKTDISFSMIFVQPYKKNYWQQRVSLKISKHLFSDLYKASVPFKIRICSKGHDYLYTIKTKDWIRQTALVNKIMQIAEYNN